MVSISRRLRRAPLASLHVLCCRREADFELCFVSARLSGGCLFSPAAPGMCVAAGRKLVKSRLVHCQSQRAFRWGSFAANYLGATLCTVLCVYPY